MADDPPPVRDSAPSPVRWLGVIGGTLSLFLLLWQCDTSDRDSANRALQPLGSPPSPIPERAMLGDRAPANPGDDVISTGDGLVSGIAVDATHLYLAEALLGDKVRKIPLAGGREVELGSARMAVALALGDNGVYIADQGSLMDSGKGLIQALPLAPGGTPQILSSGLLAPSDVAVDATHAYWVDGGTFEAKYKDGNVAKAPLAGGSRTVIAAGEEQPTSITVDATHVYWTKNGESKGHGAVMRAPLAGGEPAVIASGQALIKDVAVVGKDVYWLSADDMAGGKGVILKAPAAGGPVTQVAASTARMCRMTVDAEAVYWTDPGDYQEGAKTDGTIVKAPLGGGAPVVLASGQDRPCYVVVDAKNVYFSTQSRERVKRVAKGQSAPPP